MQGMLVQKARGPFKYSWVLTVSWLGGSKLRRLAVADWNPRATKPQFYFFTFPKMFTIKDFKKNSRIKKYRKIHDQLAQGWFGFSNLLSWGGCSRELAS